MHLRPIDVNTLKDAWDYANITATNVAAIGAIAAFILALRVFRRQLADTERAQASRISVSTGQGAHAKRSEDGKDVTVWNVSLANHSDLPIYRALVRVESCWPSEQMASGEASGPGVLFEQVSPGERKKRELHTLGTSESALISVLFDDADGRSWYRNSHGRLVTAKRTTGWYPRFTQKDRKEWQATREMTSIGTEISVIDRKRRWWRRCG